MATLDIFKQNAFSMLSILQAIDSVPHLPQRIGQLGVFTPNPVRTQTVAIEGRDGVLSLIKTSPRGAPLVNRTTEKRNIKDFRTVRIAKEDTITASELADIRAFGTESELVQVQDEVMRRFMGPTGLANDIEMTLENMRLGAIQGLVKDADGSTLMDWFDAFGVTQAAEVTFTMSGTTSSGVIRTACNNIVRAMMRAAKGVWIPSTQVYALCGDNFWDALTGAKETRETYLNTAESQTLRNGTAFETFRYGGITFENYRGTDDGTTVGIASDKAKFFPVGAPGAFLEVFSPGESFAYLNTLGTKIYPMIIPDDDRDMYVKIEAYSYPLHICTRPAMLQSGTI